MALVYRDRTYHTDQCSCCSIRDVASVNDPTGTFSLRRKWRNELGRRWRNVTNQIRLALVERDLLGMNGGSVHSSVLAISVASQGDTKIKTFQSFIDLVLNNAVLGGDGGAAKDNITAAYNKGTRFAQSVTKQTLLLPPQVSTSRIDTLSTLATVEFQGVNEAVSQKAVREVANALAKGQRAIVAFRAISDVIAKIGVTRSSAVVELLTVSAFNTATLDYFEDLGIDSVGIIPESKPKKGVTDAKRKSSARPRKGAGTRISRRKGPSASTIARILKKEQQTEAVGEWVNVATAGDDKVCPICEDIEENGPYTINEARGLIPAHPRCRCAFIPARAPRKRKLDFNPNHVPSGEHGGEFTTAGALPQGSFQETNAALKKMSENMYGDRTFNDDELAAVNAYGGDQFETINRGLRNGRTSKLSETLDGAIKKGKLPQDLTVYRGVGKTLSRQIVESWANSKDVSFVDKGFVSTSANKKVAENFSKNTMEITLPKGTNALALHTNGEAEVLLGTNHRFKVISVKKTAAGNRKIKVQLISSTGDAVPVTEETQPKVGKPEKYVWNEGDVTLTVGKRKK